jgi:hypothetical protein
MNLIGQFFSPMGVRLKSLGILNLYLFLILLVAIFGMWREGFAAIKNFGGLICRLEITLHQEKHVEIMELKKQDNEKFDAIYIKSYIEGKEKPSTKLIATALTIVNIAENNPMLVELNTSNHGQQGTYFDKVQTSIIAQTTLATAGSLQTSNTLIFYYTRTLQDHQFNQRLIDEEIIKMPIDTCQIQD